MIAQFHWNEADFVSAQKVWLRHHPVAHLRGYWFPVAVAVLSVAILIFKPEHGIASLVGIALALVLFGVSALRTRWRWHRQFKRSALGDDEVTAKVDKNGLSLHSQSYDVYHSWGECSDIYESEGVINFETANGSFVFIPKRNLSHAQLRDLRSTIVTYARVQPSLASQPA